MFINTYKEYSDSTIKKVIGQFRQAFKYAYDKGYIARNPMSQVIRPKSIKPPKIVRAMTLDEESKFVNYIQRNQYKNVHIKMNI